MASSGILAAQTTPLVEERSALAVACPDSATTTVIADMPCIHAETVDVIISSDQNVTAVLLNKAAYGQITLTSSLGAVTGGTPKGFVYGQAGGGALLNPVGVSCTLQITNASGNDAVVSAWLCARS